jgi:enoyl-CoA hydratase
MFASTPSPAGLSTALLDEAGSGVGLLLLDRPARAHAYNAALLDAFEEGLSRLEAQVGVIVVASTGQGAFCGGADLKELAAADPLSALDLRSQRLFTRLAQSPATSVAALQGPAVAGGAELALACDLRVVGPRASLRLPETAMGLIPSAGGCTRLTRLVGPSVARQVILAGKVLSAEEGLRYGLFAELADDPQAAALALARLLAQRDPVALRLARQVIDLAEPEASLRMERLSEALLYSRRSARSGV